jgi:hypothetical protein
MYLRNNILTEWHKSGVFHITVMTKIQKCVLSASTQETEKMYTIQNVNLNKFPKFCLKHYFNLLSTKYNIPKILFYSQVTALMDMDRNYNSEPEFY